jgi:hypothetical protein
MLRFCGFGLELFIDEVLERDHDDPVEAERKDKDLSWLCAPASTRAVDLVAAGLTSAADAVRHSTTGWVEVVSVIDGHSVPDRRLSCSDLSAKHPLATPLSL